MYPKYPPLKSLNVADGMYSKTCCSPIRIRGSYLYFEHDKIKVLIESNKVGIVGYPAKPVGHFYTKRGLPAGIRIPNVLYFDGRERPRVFSIEDGNGLSHVFVRAQ